MVTLAVKPVARPLTEADKAAIYEMLTDAPRTPAQVAAALQVEQMYIDQHLAFEAVTGVIAQHDGRYFAWRSEL